jgi:Tfp pilus assembly protein PilF
MSHAQCLKLRDDWTEQEAVLKDMLKIAPDNPDVLNGYGYELTLHGERLPEALSMIERAVTASPANGSYLDSLAWAQFKLGQLAQAMQSIQAASHAEPKSTTILEHYGDIALANHDPTSASAAWSALLKIPTDTEQKTRVHAKLTALGTARAAP